MEYKDKRIHLMNELLNGIKVAPLLILFLEIRLHTYDTSNRSTLCCCGD